MSIDEMSVKMLDAATTGEVLTSESSDYDEIRKIWNGMFDKKPAIIVRCNSEKDVVEAVKFARKNNMLVAVKSGGHNSAGTGSCDDGLMIDLSLLNKVAVDPIGKTVRVQGGCLLSDVDAATQEYGLAVPAGIISHTGVGGLTLGGGMGWISRKHGFSIDNLVSARVVTAEGQVIKASQDENPDLFWAIRGGGGNFGIVTEFEFKGAAIGTEVYSGPIVKSFDNARDYIRFHRDYVRKMPDEMSIWMVIRHAPPLPFLAEEHHWKLVIIVLFVYLGDPETGRQLTQPIRDFGTTLGDGSGMHPWRAWQSAFDGLVTHGARNYWKSHNLKGLPDDSIDIICDFASRMPSNQCEVFVPHMEGVPSRIPSDETAYSFRKHPFVMNIHTRWEEAKDDEKCLKWARDFYEATKPYSQGVYVNFISDEGEARAREAYTDSAWSRLKQAKKKWDPSNFFRVNMNISPNGSA